MINFLVKKRIQILKAIFFFCLVDKIYGTYLIKPLPNKKSRKLTYKKDRNNKHFLLNQKMPREKNPNPPFDIF